MFVYVTESKSLVESDGGFLFWFEKELKYGDWTSGQNGDGTLKKTGQIEISEVLCNVLVASCRNIAWTVACCTVCCKLFVLLNCTCANCLLLGCHVLLNLQTNFPFYLNLGRYLL